MIYFADSTPYCYDGAEEDDRIVNVGWLSKDPEFPRGTVPPEFDDQLRQLITAPTNLFRGVHLCEFCPHPETHVGENGLRMLESNPETTSNGEIRITGNDGIIYVSPVRIRHYVTAHEYRPPQAFIDAVLTDR